MTNRLEQNRRALDSRPAARRWFSPAARGLELATCAAIGRYVRGATLDAGCGAMPYRATIERTAGTYDGLDIESRAEGVRYLCSVTDMAPVADAAYDSVVCSEVLEHVADPDRAAAELARVLRPGGSLVITVPFLARLHEEPHDYQRFTEHGLTTVLARAGLETVEITRTGSVASFLGHQVSSATVPATWHVPILRWLVLAANAGFVVLPARGIDRLLGPIGRKLPLGYVAVATKR